MTDQIREDESELTNEEAILRHSHMNLRQALSAEAATSLHSCSDSPISKRMAKRLRRKVVRQLGKALIREELE